MQPSHITANGAILEVKHLTKEYASGGGVLTVVKDITFSIPAGSTRAIVGPSGSGKTTLLGLCAGLDQPTSGEVRLDGIHLGALDEDGRAGVRNESVGFVFQSFQLIPTLTALENVMVPLELRGEAGAAARRGTCWDGWGWRGGSRIIRRNFREANSNGWGWRAHLSTGRRFCSRTNRPGISTRRRGGW